MINRDDTQINLKIKTSADENTYINKLQDISSELSSLLELLAQKELMTYYVFVMVQILLKNILHLMTLLNV